jgi:hypothetical protein
MERDINQFAKVLLGCEARIYRTVIETCATEGEDISSRTAPMIAREVEGEYAEIVRQVLVDFFNWTPPPVPVQMKPPPAERLA